MNFKQIVFGVFILSAVSCSEENIESNSDIINKSTDLGSLTYRIEYNGGGEAIMTKLSNHEYDGKISLNSEIDWGSTFYYRAEENSSIKIYDESNNEVLDFDFPIISSAPFSYPGDCNELGPRRAGEGFKDCVGRNFTNFCCDLTGCLVVGTNPQAVAIASALVCAPSSSGNIYDYVSGIYDIPANNYIYEDDTN